MQCFNDFCLEESLASGPTSRSTNFIIFGFNYNNTIPHSHASVLCTKLAKAHDRIRINIYRIINFIHHTFLNFSLSHTHTYAETHSLIACLIYQNDSTHLNSLNIRIDILFSNRIYR